MRLAVCGGSFIGMLTSIYLKDLFEEIIIFEKNDYSKHLNEYDSRGIALNLLSESILDKVGLLKIIPERSLINGIKISNGQGISNLLKKHNSHLGCIVDAGYLRTCLYDAVLKIDNIKFAKEELTSISHEENKWSLNKYKSFDLIVGADGFNSFVRNHMNISATVKTNFYKMYIANVELKNHSSNIAYEFFINNRVIALLPVKNHIYKLVIEGHSEKDALSFLESAKTDEIKIKLITKLEEYKISNLKCKGLIFNQGVLCGNAANTFYPIGAQGLNTGFYDCKVLYDSLSLGLSKGLTINKCLSLYSNSIKPMHEKKWYFVNFLQMINNFPTSFINGGIIFNKIFNELNNYWLKVGGS